METVAAPQQAQALADWENNLHQALVDVALLGELNLTRQAADEIAQLIARLVQQWGFAQATRILETTYPCCLAAFLVAQGIYGYESGDYWSSVERALGRATNVGSRWGPFFEGFLHTHGLPRFVGVQAHRYVSTILLHGGVPQYCLPDFFAYVLPTIAQHAGTRAFETNEVINDWLATTPHAVDRPVQRFLAAGGRMANDTLVRCLDLVRHYAEHNALPQASEIGLPQRIVEAYGAWANTHAQSPLLNRVPSARWQRPTIVCDPWAGELVAELPAQHLLSGSANTIGAWTLSASGNHTRVPTYTERRADGWFTEPTYAELAQPCAEYQIAFRTGDMERTWRFTGITAQMPLLVFDPATGCLVPWRAALPARSCWLLYPDQQTLHVEGGTLRETLPRLPSAWAAYRLETWDLRAATTVRIGTKTVPAEPDLERLRPFLDDTTQPSVLNDQHTLLYVGVPPTINIPLPPNVVRNPGADWRTEAARWRITITPHDQRAPWSLPVLDLTAELAIEPDCLRLPLHSARLLGTHAFGTFDVLLRGPLGRDARWTLSVVPQWHIAGHEHVRLPNEHGHRQPAHLQVRVAAGMRLESPDPGAHVAQREPSSYQITFPADRTVAELRLRAPGTSATVGLAVPLPMLRWMVTGDAAGNEHASWQTIPVTQPRVWLDQTAAPNIVLMVAPSTCVQRAIDVCLLVHHSATEPPQTLRPRGSQRAGWVFNLAEAADTIRASRSSTVVIEAKIGQLPGHMEPVRVPVMQLSQDIAVEALVVDHCLVDDTWLVSATWCEAQPLQQRCLRLWPRWRPWDRALEINVPDAAINEYESEILRAHMPPGAYRVEFAVLDPWSVRTPSAPSRAAHATVEVLFGTAAEQQAYVDALPFDITGWLERALASDDSAACLAAVQQAATHDQPRYLAHGFDTFCALLEREAHAAPCDDALPAALFTLQQWLLHAPLDLFAELLRRWRERDAADRAPLLDVATALAPEFSHALDLLDHADGMSVDELVQVAPLLAPTSTAHAALKQMLIDAGVHVIDAPATSQQPSPPRDEWLFGFADLPLLDPLTMYLREIGQIALLSAEQEQRLAKRVVVARDARRELHTLNAGSVQTRLLRDRVSKGDAARDELAGANLRLVVSIAKRYQNRGLALLDLIQEGNIGLLRAIDKFEPERGHKFSTYATWWIRQAVTRALLDQTRLIRLPVHVGEDLGQINKVVNQFFQTMGRDPTTAELAAVLDMTEEKVTDIQRATGEPVSLDAPSGTDDDGTLIGFVRDAQLASIDAQMEHQALRMLLDLVLDTLEPRERRVLELRYGFHDDQKRTLEEVGRLLDVTRERARQIESEALKKLRTHQATLQSVRMTQRQQRDVSLRAQRAWYVEQLNDFRE